MTMENSDRHLLREGYFWRNIIMMLFYIFTNFLFFDIYLLLF